jgi:hypothetical protein
MVAKRKAITDKRRIKKLKLKKETLRDLDAKRRVKGGAVPSAGCDYHPSQDCLRLGSAACSGDTCNCTISCLYTCYCKK